MIIDCHGHYTTAPRQLHAYRRNQLDELARAWKAPAKSSIAISDDEIRESVEKNQIRQQRERGSDHAERARAPIVRNNAAGRQA